MARPINLLAQTIKPRQTVSEYSLAVRLPDAEQRYRNKTMSPRANPSTLAREFAAECMELAENTLSPEKRAIYLKMASVWHQMAIRSEIKTKQNAEKRVG